MRSRAQAAFDRHYRELLSHPGVTLVVPGEKLTGGHPTGRSAVIVGVERKRPPSLLHDDELLPQTLRPAFSAFGIETDVIETGPIKALEAPLMPSAIADRHQPWRPAPGGVSIGHYAITAGTLGMVTVTKAGYYVGLSNNHVLANSNAGKIGDAIYQPGPHDGGTVANQIGVLHAYVPIVMDGAPPIPDECPIATKIASVLSRAAKLIGSQSRYRAVDAAEENVMDAALVALQHDTGEEYIVLDATEQKLPVSNIMERDIVPGIPVAKSGRTTGFTTGTLAAVEAAVRVQYGAGKTATFVRQLIIQQAGFSAGGDSGSVVYNPETRRIIGLLFAGSDQVTIVNPIGPVAAALDLDLV